MKKSKKYLFTEEEKILGGKISWSVRKIKLGKNHMRELAKKSVLARKKAREKVYPQPS